MKYLILTLIIFASQLQAGRPGEELDRVIFPDGMDRWRNVQLPSGNISDIREHPKKAFGTDFGAWIKEFPLFTQEEPTPKKCSTTIELYESAEEHRDKYRPGEIRYEDPEWCKNGPRAYAGSLSQISQAAMYYYPPAIGKLRSYFSDGYHLDTPYAIPESDARRRFYQAIFEHLNEYPCYQGDRFCIACRWAKMYKSAQKEHRKKDIASCGSLPEFGVSPKAMSAMVFGGILTQRTPSHHDEGVASASSDDEQHPASFNNDDGLRKRLLTTRAPIIRHQTTLLEDAIKSIKDLKEAEMMSQQAKEDLEEHMRSQQATEAAEKSWSTGSFWRKSSMLRK